MKSPHCDVSASQLSTPPTYILHRSPTNVPATTHHALLIQAFSQVRGSSNLQALILGTDDQTSIQLPKTNLRIPRKSFN